MTQKQHLKGLTDQQVIESRAKYGQNILTPPEKESLWKLFIEKFQDPIIRILLIAAFLSLGIAIFEHLSSGEMHYTETIGIFFAILLATGVAFWFEMDANKKFDILNQVNDDVLVKVIRNGNVVEIPKQQIVVGDVVLLDTGDEVPADGELAESISLQIDESTLTGEPIINKTIDPTEFDEEATYPSNWVMRGTKVMDGHGVFIVKRVGDATEYGKVAEKSSEMTTEKTPLSLQLDNLAKFIGVVGLTLAALTFIVLFLKDIFGGTVTYTLGQLGLLSAVIAGALVALIKVWLPIIYDGFELLGKEKKLPNCVVNWGWLKWGAVGMLTAIAIIGVGWLFGVNPTNPNSWVDMKTARHVLQYFMISVTLIVVAIPEGLPMSVTLSLAMSMRRMLKTNNLVRKMHACETMGATTVICTDKTGTLTQNQMQVAEDQFYALVDNTLGGNDSVSNLIKEGISINSTAFLDFSNPEKVNTLGNPTEAALLLWLNSKGINYLDIREDANIVDQLTFSTERKYMATIVKHETSNKFVLYVKGAPEIIMDKCSQLLKSDGVQNLGNDKASIEELLLNYQNQAMRTLGFAYKEFDTLPKDKDIKELVESDLVFLGVVAISDPIRQDVPAAVAECLGAGIKVKIVTGDTPATAREIGRQIGIWTESDTDINIITGPNFEALSDEEAEKIVLDLKIMCRARPTDKQRLVELLQKKGSVVAVTGDGTNDAPALNHANVGLSMGSGTSVAKEASDITLLDDSFKSIATAVMWGRSLYQNIQRFILFQLTINVTALILVFLGSIFGAELPLTVTQMLWINLIMDTFAAGALASLPPDHKVMKEKPRDNNSFIINSAMRNAILFGGLSFVVILLAMMYVFAQPDLLNSIFSNVTGDKVAYSLSFFFTFFVMLQFWNMFNAKAFATGRSAFANMGQSKGFIAMAIVIIIGQFLIVVFGGDVFRTVQLHLRDWLLIIGSTSIVLWIGEIVRLIKK